VDLDAGELPEPRVLPPTGIWPWRMPEHSLPDGSFQSVTSVCAVEHMDGLSTVLHELSRVLAPGGRVFMTVPSDQFGDLLLASRIWRA